MSGGEPTLHADLPDLLRAIRALGSVKLDTNGTRPGVWARCWTRAWWTMWPWTSRRRWTRATPRWQAARSASPTCARAWRLLRHWDPTAQCYEFRTTAGPGLDVAALRDIAREIAPREHWLMQPYVPPKGSADDHVTGSFLDVDALTGLACELRGVLPLVGVRGE